jgi:hypothetical protein
VGRPTLTLDDITKAANDGWKHQAPTVTFLSPGHSPLMALYEQGMQRQIERNKLATARVEFLTKNPKPRFNWIEE